MKRLSPLAPLSLLLLATLVAGGCDSKPLGGSDGCTYNGKSYPAGATFKDKDNCNDCSCQDGQALCTLKACLDGSTDVGTGICFDSSGNQVMCTASDAGAKDGGTPDAGAKDGGGTCFDSSGKTIPCATDGGVSCTYGGKVYKPSQNFPCSDGCNVCACAIDGQITTTGKACADAGTDLPATCFDAAGNVIPCGSDAGVECLYDNKPYPLGASFPSADGCNTCSCTAGGMIACTERACADSGMPADGGTDAPGMCFDANGKTAPCAPDGGPAGVCMPGVDQSCNDNVMMNSIAGKCRPDATCDCGAGTKNPATGRCVPSGTAAGCTYDGVTYPVGSKFMCTVDAGCNDGVCVCATPGVTVPLCGGEPVPACGFDAVYIYGQIGGLVTYSDQVTLTPPASYVLVRTATPNTGNATSGSCGPVLPACTSGPIDVSVIMRDISDPTVQLLLSLSAMQPTLLGIDQRPVDGTVFSFKKSGTAGFLVGAPCNGAANCTDVPAGVRNLMDDLQKLDAQQRQDPSCAFTKTM